MRGNTPDSRPSVEVKWSPTSILRGINLHADEDRRATRQSLLAFYCGVALMSLNLGIAVRFPETFSIAMSYALWGASAVIGVGLMTWSFMLRVSATWTPRSGSGTPTPSRRTPKQKARSGRYISKVGHAAAKHAERKDGFHVEAAREARRDGWRDEQR